MGEGGASVRKRVGQRVGKLPSSELEPGWDRGPQLAGTDEVEDRYQVL